MCTWLQAGRLVCSCAHVCLISLCRDGDLHPAALVGVHSLPERDLWAWKHALQTQALINCTGCSKLGQAPLQALVDMLTL